MRIIGSTDAGFKPLLSEILNRGEQDPTLVEEAVKEIIAAVKARGDKALIEYTKRFDKADIKGSFQVSQAEAEKALRSVSKSDLDLMRLAASPIESFHKKQIEAHGFLLAEVSHDKQVSLRLPNKKGSPK